MKYTWTWNKFCMELKNRKFSSNRINETYESQRMGRWTPLKYMNLPVRTTHFVATESQACFFSAKWLNTFPCSSFLSYSFSSLPTGALQIRGIKKIPPAQCLWNSFPLFMWPLWIITFFTSSKTAPLYKAVARITGNNLYDTAWILKEEFTKC